MFDGLAYMKTPIAHIRSSKNNTVINVCNPDNSNKLAQASGVKKARFLGSCKIEIYATYEIISTGVKYMNVGTVDHVSV